MKKCSNCGVNIEDDKTLCENCESNNLNNKRKSILNSNQKKFILIIIIVSLVLVLVAYFYKPSLEIIKDSVVKIEVYDDNNDLLATGSGFCAYKSNYIITNYHVIEGAYSIKVITDDNQKHDVNNILIFNVDDDLAILNSSVNLKPLTFGNAQNLKSGDKISTIGSPLGELNTVSNGIISNADNSKGIQISSPISHGSSGGVLLDRKNRVIGIIYASLDEGNSLNYAIKIDTLEKMKKALDEKQFEQLQVMNNVVFDIIAETTIETNNRFFLNDSKKYYSANNIKILYANTNPKRIFERIINSKLYSIYKTLDSNQQNVVAKTYEELVKKDFKMTNYSIKWNINSWSISDYFIRLDVLKKSELSLVMVDIKNTSNNDLFNKVNSYPFSVGQKILIYYLIGNVSWSDIGAQNKKQLFDYLNGKGYKTEDLVAILEKLGYRVRYNNNGTLTAYW